MRRDVVEGDDRPGADRAPLRRVDGQRPGVSLEEDDRPARPPAALQGDVVSALEQRLGDRRLPGPVRGGRLPGHPGVQHGRDAAGHGRLHRLRQRAAGQRAGARSAPPTATRPRTGSSTWSWATRSAWTRNTGSASGPSPRPSGPSIRRSCWSWAISPTASRSPTRTASKGAASGITNLSAHRKILELARRHGREVWFDIHIGTEHPGALGELAVVPTYVDALAKIERRGEAQGGRLRAERRQPRPAPGPGQRRRDRDAPAAGRPAAGRLFGQRPAAGRPERQRLGPGAAVPRTPRRCGCSRPATSRG